MNWTRFQTYGASPDRAFEMLCNQLFENWCKSEYSTQLASVNVVNGAGGDGGVESYATLINGDIIGLQAKWFLNSIGPSQILQIKSSVETAIKVRSEIVRYIVCVPRDLASKTVRKGKTEDERWNEFISELSTIYPHIKVELWNDTRITTEMQKSESSGIHRFWFENEELTDECFRFAMDKAIHSWLSTKYVPELNVAGEINDTLGKFLGGHEHRKAMVTKLSTISQLSCDFEKAARELLSVCGNESEKLMEIIRNAGADIRKLKTDCDNILNWMDNDASNVPIIPERDFTVDFEYIADCITNCEHSFLYYSHIYEVKKVLNKLGKIDCYQILSDVDDCFNKQNILFLGNPGTGKTQGIGAFSEKIISEGLHFPILVQARSVPQNQKWHDIIVQNLGLSSVWSEEDIWRALISTANRHKFTDRFINDSIKIEPKVLIMVDGIDESSDHDVWISRIQEAEVISKKYPQIRFSFTSRPAAIPSNLRNVRTIHLSMGGDVPAFKLFDSYIKKYNITVKNKGWLKYAITTPLALKLFCELNMNSTVNISSRYEVSMNQLWKKRIEGIERELEIKEKLPPRNQYVLHSIIILSSYFVAHTSIEQNELVNTLHTELYLGIDTVQKLISYFELCGILQCYCKKGKGLSLDKYNYCPGIQGYFDYATAMTLLEKYEKPQNINFEECQEITINTCYALSIISIQKYNYLITYNDTIGKVLAGYSLAELQFSALQNSSYETAQQFVTHTKEIMSESAEALATIVNNLVLPLSRDIEHPLGVSMLNDFLNSFKFPAQRDILWSVPLLLYNSEGKKWQKETPLALEDEEYTLSPDDTHNGLPIIYAWALSTVDNTLRKKYRDALMRWAQINPQEYYDLFIIFSDVNDPQIRSDLFSVLMCLMYDGATHELLKSVSKWICDNILSPEKVDENRDISIRYYSIAIVERAKMLDVISDDEARKYLPPYTSEKYQIALNKDALSGTRMSGYSAIDYDLSRYVLIDHLESKFNSYTYRKNDQLKKMIKKATKDNFDYSGITFEQFILSVVYAFILNMGWNELEFFNYEKNKDGELIGGVDCSIGRYYYPATHGAQSRVMTVCEKYVWQARNAISGFLSDRLLYGNEKIQLTDYGMLDDFNIPIQEISQIDPDNIPDDRPWHIPELSAVILEKENESQDEVILSVLNAPNINWKEWIIFKNEQGKYAVTTEELLALSAFSCFIGSNGVETDLFINSIIVDSKDVPAFITQLKTNKELPEEVSIPSDWNGGIESSCYITPKEICWFPWKKRYDSYNAEKFPGLGIQSAVDECTYNFPEYGDVHYLLPSAPIRQLLGIIDSDGYRYWDKDGVVRSEYSISGEQWHTQQDYLMANKNLILEKLSAQGKELVWFMEDIRRETSSSRERYGEFNAERRINYVGYFKEGQFRVEELKKETSSQKS